MLLSHFECVDVIFIIIQAVNHLHFFYKFLSEIERGGGCKCVNIHLYLNTKIWKFINVFAHMTWNLNESDVDDDNDGAVA